MSASRDWPRLRTIDDVLHGTSRWSGTDHRYVTRGAWKYCARCGWWWGQKGDCPGRPAKPPRQTTRRCTSGHPGALPGSPYQCLGLVDGKDERCSACRAGVEHATQFIPDVEYKRRQASAGLRRNR